MPLYEYTCLACGHEFELLVRRRETPSCPSCESRELEQRLSLPAIRSDGTRRLAMRAAKKRDAAQAQDRMHEQLRYEQTHDRHG